MAQDRISYDTDASAQVETDIGGIVGRLEALIGDRDQQVATAMADFYAEGISEDYQHIEQKWKGSADEVREIIRLVKETLLNNDETAGTTQQRGRTAVQNIH
ncbi:pore-forming ESAT-6 family protein [Arthrobacter castelli]|uniref:pore-forming ESAT-6 family protein n=1 Tax=Arthrobacter castelli TaxID=271431 RepID=UPI0003F7AF52|nr:pore-forming ESAT-6 family protein [Arthrobacter castelli]